MAFKDYKPADVTKFCVHREHNPPSHIVLQPGTHNWQCPGCGHVTTFVVQNPSLMLPKIIL